MRPRAGPARRRPAKAQAPAGLPALLAAQRGLDAGAGIAAREAAAHVARVAAHETADARASHARVAGGDPLAALAGRLRAASEPRAHARAGRVRVAGDEGMGALAQ